MPCPCVDSTPPGFPDPGFNSSPVSNLKTRQRRRPRTTQPWATHSLVDLASVIPSRPWHHPWLNTEQLFAARSRPVQRPNREAACMLLPAA